MIPLRDALPTRRRPIVTKAIVLANVAVFVLTFQDTLAAARALGAVAWHLTGETPEPWLAFPEGPELPVIERSALSWLRPLTHMFVHGDLWHLLGNLWFLWVFGDNVEDRLGKARFALFYLASGLAALAAQVVADPASGMPMVGASGAIAGVLGGYLVLYPHARVLTLVPFGFLPLLVAVRASLFLWLWLGIQVVSGLAASEPGVAWWAHIGGFGFGMAAVKVLAPPARRVQVTVG